jgi:hypothetical protein
VPDVTKATTDPVGHVPWGPGRPIVTVTVAVAPGMMAVIPVLVPAVFRHNTVPAGSLPSAAWSVTSKTVPSGQPVGIGVGVGVAVGVGVGVGVAVGVGVGTTVGVGVCVCGGLSLWSANPVT